MANPNFPNNPGYNLYVGARYVPLVNGEWSATESYEPLTVVTYLGNSYTSKTFVPVGVNPTNTTYWALTGNYNAQVEGYREEVERYANTVNSLIPSINYGLEKFRNKRICIMGTSNEQLITINNENGWSYYFKEALTGVAASVDVLHPTEYTFLGANGLASLFINSAQNYDMVIVAGIRNDFFNNANPGNPYLSANEGLTTLSGCLYQMGQKISATPNLDAYLTTMIVPGYISGYITRTYPFAVYNTIFANLGSRQGFKVLDVTNFANNRLTNTQITADGRHLKEPYTRYFAYDMISSIIGFSGQVPYIQQTINGSITNQLFTINEDYASNFAWNYVRADIGTYGVNINMALNVTQNLVIPENVHFIFLGRLTAPIVGALKGLVLPTLGQAMVPVIGENKTMSIRVRDNGDVFLLGLDNDTIAAGGMSLSIEAYVRLVDFNAANVRDAMPTT